MAGSDTFDLDGESDSGTAPDPEGVPPTDAPDTLVDEAAAPVGWLPPGLIDQGELGTGGMGEVRRVWDQELERSLACKIMRADLSPAAQARFLREAYLTARLAHPGVVPVHRLGRLPDGRPYFTMEQIRGRTLDRVVLELHVASARGWGSSPEGWTLHRVVDVLRRVCETVAYAHAQGVVHRDIKPANLMVADFGRVVVLDWGIARVGEGGLVGEAPLPAGPQQTRAGARAGTVGWMAPEQERGDNAQVGPHTDVYALGCVLFLILTGLSPRRAGVSDPARCARLPLPEELVAACRRAMAPEPAQRWPDASALERALGDWLEGARREERAAALVAQADARLPHLRRRRARALRLRERAQALLAELPPHAGAAARGPAWALEDVAEGLERALDLAELELVQTWSAALLELPTYAPAHERLAAWHQQEGVAAEQRGDLRALRRAEALVAAHDQGAHGAWLSGRGTLSLQTDPPGAQARVSWFTLHGRRLTPATPEPLGPTPVEDQELRHGSLLLELEAPGCAPLALPLLLRRGERWTHTPPGAPGPLPLRLPPAGSLAEGEHLVPAGWAELGDPTLSGGLPRRRIWVDSFVMRRHPVTNAEYLGFLNALLADGREDVALACAPRASGGDPAHPGAPLYPRLADGRFTLGTDAEGDAWQPEWPVVLVTWPAAMAFAAWEAARTGQPWRLAWAPEREKAARGADGRSLPWGEQQEPTWTRNALSSPGRPTPAAVGVPPEDCSVYGVHGLAGNVRDWTLSAHVQTWEHVQPDGRFAPPPAGPDPADATTWRLTLGGAWNAGPGLGRAGYRLAAPPGHRNALLGLRLVRGWL